MENVENSVHEISFLVFPIFPLDETMEILYKWNTFIEKNQFITSNTQFLINYH